MRLNALCTINVASWNPHRDELQLARVGVDVAYRIYTGHIRAVIQRIHLYCILW